MPDPAIVSRHIDAIEAEMKRLNAWQAEPLPDEAYEDMGAFGMNTMTLEQWLQFVLVPRVRQIIEEGGSFPGGSQVAQQAFRNWKVWGDDTDTTHDKLLELLRDFDALF